eukprot:scaffold273674_cov38-Prasinocladus_malaysianus.AAC.1
MIVLRSLWPSQKVLASSFADRPTHTAVQSLIEEAIEASNGDVLSRVQDIVDNHTHVVEHSERVLLREDGTKVVVESGTLSGIKVQDDGKQSAELWSRVQSLTAEQKALQRRLADHELRSRSPQKRNSRPGSPPAADVHPAVAIVKQRMLNLENAHERTVEELRVRADESIFQLSMSARARHSY